MLDILCALPTAFEQSLKHLRHLPKPYWNLFSHDGSSDDPLHVTALKPSIKIYENPM